MVAESAAVETDAAAVVEGAAERVAEEGAASPVVAALVAAQRTQRPRPQRENRCLPHPSR